jgi:RNA polymerase sigma-70 factor, ECF subfamily
VAVGTVKSRTNRARGRLCELLGLAAGEDILDEARSTLAVMGRSGMQAA